MQARPHWLSRNPDKAFGEKLFLSFIPVFFAYNAAVQQLGWLDAGTFWHVVQNLAMWFPYCVLLPAWLRRRAHVPWRRSYWLKANLFMAVWVFYATYFHTEYFFVLLGLRYRFRRSASASTPRWSGPPRRPRRRSSRRYRSACTSTRSRSSSSTTPRPWCACGA